MRDKRVGDTKIIVKAGKTAYAPEYDLSVFIVIGTVGELIVLKAVRGEIRKNFTAGRVQFGDTAVGTYPQFAKLICNNSVDGVVG